MDWMANTFHWGILNSLGTTTDSIESKLNRAVIFNVLLPGVTMGLLLMLVGQSFIYLSIYSPNRGGVGSRKKDGKNALKRSLREEKGSADIHLKLGG